LDVICLDTPSGEVVEVSSSCDLSVCSPKTDAQFTKSGGNDPKGSLRASTVEFWAEMDMMNEISHRGNAPVGSSSVNTEELWDEMDMMDEISHGGTSVGNIPRNTHRERRSLPSVEKTGECAGRVDKGALLNDTPGPSNTQPRGSGKDSVKKKAAQILSAALGAISPRL
jgi:hypothetical protein